MTYLEREEIFSKEVIDYKEFAQLFDISKTAACSKVKDIKRKVGDRAGVQGKLHILDYFGISDNERYSKLLTIK